MERLKNKKVFVGKYSKEIQEKAFELGFRWLPSSDGILWNLKVPFLFFNKGGIIAWTNDVELFNEDEFEEVSPEYILSLETKPKWEDFGEVEGYRVGEKAMVKWTKYITSFEGNCDVFPSKEEAEACLALSQLCQWRDRYNDGWKPDWNDYESSKYIIEYNEDKIEVDTYESVQRVLAFKSPEIRNKFLEDFQDLIEQAKPLL